MRKYINQEQIIKALEYCTYNDKCVGEVCPFFEEGCERNMPAEALAVIKELSEENERVKAQALALIKEIDEENDRLVLKLRAFECISLIKQNQAKAATVREMHELIRERCIEGGVYPAFVASTIDQIAKEMLGEKDEKEIGHPDPVGPIGPKGVNGDVAAAVHAVKEKFALSFGTYTDKDTVRVMEVFALLEKICREVEETDFDSF